MAIDPLDIVDASDEPSLPGELTVPRSAIVLITFPRTSPNVTPQTFGATLDQLQALLTPAATPALPIPAAPTFADFNDTNEGGSVRLVPATGVPMADYRYKVGANGTYLPAPVDGIISVGNIADSVYAFSVATGSRQQSDVRVSTAFTTYTAPSPTAPAPPTFTNFTDTNAGGTVQLVPASGVPLADYQVKIGDAGNYVQAPMDGVISVGNVDGRVYAYSIATANRLASQVASSVGFTSYTAPPAATVPAAPTYVTASAGNASVSVTGSAPANGGSAITGYNVYRSGTTPAIATGVASLPYVDTTVVNGTAYTYQLAAVNAIGEGAKSAASNSVTPSAPNVAPTASAGINQTITLPTSSTQLTGSGSDSDGTIASYAWSQQAGPNFATFSSTSAAAPTVSGLVAGTYTFRLTVTDNAGATGTSDVSVTVNPAAPVYTDLLTGPSQTDSSGMTLTSGGAEVLRYSLLATGDTTAKRMNISVGGNVLAAVDFPARYLGASFTFTPVGGTAHTGTFTDGTVTI